MQRIYAPDTDDKRRKEKRMTSEDLINIAIDFDKWLKTESEKYGINKDDIQGIIKDLLK